MALVPTEALAKCQRRLVCPGQRVRGQVAGEGPPPTPLQSLTLRHSTIPMMSGASLTHPLGFSASAARPRPHCRLLHLHPLGAECWPQLQPHRLVEVAGGFAASFALLASLGGRGSDFLTRCGCGHDSESKCAQALPCLILWHVIPAIATFSPLPSRLFPMANFKVVSLAVIFLGLMNRPKKNVILEGLPKK